jgi:putative cell wall-binding protein
VASGNSVADALAGSYLAAKLKAPILITSANNQEIIQMYVFKSLKSGGTLYILGGEKAVQPSFVAGLESFLNIKRLEGSNRYETNLAILKEEKAAVAPGSEILVCTGTDFADSLSASATGKPILLVRNTLTDSQKEYLHSLGTNSKFTIIGGVSAVSEGIAEELKAYGTVSRLGGNNRYETATWVANAYFNKPKTAVVAYGHNFPDGLCGGPLAYFTGAPLLLAHDSRVHPADAFTDAFGITQGYVLGGEAVLSDESVLNIFDTKAELFVENETVVSEDSLTGDLGGSLGDSLGDIDPDQLEGILGDLLGGLLGSGSEETKPAPEATPAQ